MPAKALLIFFNGKSNAGGAERMVLYLDEYLQSRGVNTQIIDETHLRNTWLGKQYWKLFNYRHFLKRKPIYMARFASAYCWWRWRPGRFTVSNGESTPFFPVSLVISQGCYHVMERAYGRKDAELSRMSKLQMRGIRLAYNVITVTEQVERNLVKYYGIEPAKISLVANRVDTSFFQPLPKEMRPFKTVLYAGRLENGKGLPLVVRLANLVEEQTDWRLLIACNNSFNTELFFGLKNTTIQTGLQLHNINELAYSKADIVIFPSMFESFGMITIEALSAGVPVLGTPVGIIPNLAERNFSGVYVLTPEVENNLLPAMEKMIEEFQLVDRNILHQVVQKEFGIASYRKRLDEVLGKRLKFKGHA